jgi:hypothetical protein
MRAGSQTDAKLFVGDAGRMSRVSADEQFTQVVADLAELYKGGSGASVVVGCRAITALSPVRAAIDGGARETVAARLFLEFVAQRAEAAKDLDTLVGAALAGITPRSTGRGVRGQPGKGERAANAGLTADGRAAKTITRRSDDYFRAYAASVIAVAQQCARDPDLLSEFLRLCLVSEQDVARLTRQPVEIRESGNNTTAAVSLQSLARAVPLAGALSAALEASRASCAAQGRAFYTLDLLLVLVDLPGGRVASCLDQARAGASSEVREWLHRTLAELAGLNTHPFQRFEWVERPEVRQAQDLALEDGTGIVTEVHLFMGALGGDSSSVESLARLLGSAGATVKAAADRMRRELPHALRTPAPVHDRHGAPSVTPDHTDAQASESPNKREPT